MRKIVALAVLATSIIGSSARADEPTLAEKQAAYNLLVITYKNTKVMIDAGFCTEPNKRQMIELLAVAKRLDVTKAQLDAATNDETEQSGNVRKIITSFKLGSPESKELAQILCLSVVRRAGDGTSADITPKEFQPFSDKYKAEQVVIVAKATAERERGRAKLPPLYAKAFADIEAGTLTVAQMKALGELDMIMARVFDARRPRGIAGRDVLQPVPRAA